MIQIKLFKTKKIISFKKQNLIKFLFQIKLILKLKQSTSKNQNTNNNITWMKKKKCDLINFLQAKEDHEDLQKSEIY